MKIEAKLSWVIIESSLHNVKEFSHLPPNARPKACCPECRRDVIMRLGTKRIFHAAHKAHDNCPTTQPETALHLNVKFFIANELIKNKSLLITSNCIGSENILCSNNINSTYFEKWDDVKVEYKIDQYRPDIVLLRNKETIGALEIFVTHSIEPQKEQYLHTLSIPWIEISADTIIDGFGKEIWNIELPLIYKKINQNFLKKLKCDSCVAIEKKEKIRKEKLKNSHQYITTGIRFIDFYYPGYKSFRAIYFSKKRIQGGKITELLIDDYKDTICQVYNKNFPNSRKKLNELFNKHLDKFRKQGYQVDSHMNWEKWDDQYKPIVSNLELNVFYFPKRYFWSEFCQKWIQIGISNKVSWNLYFSNKESYLEKINKLLEIYKKRETMGEPNKLKIYDRSKNQQKNPSSTPRKIIGQPKQLSKIDKEVECSICKQSTLDYWNYDEKTNTCKCRKCLKEIVANYIQKKQNDNL